MEMLIVDFLFRWLHVLAGITWVGMLFYFNFVQAPYFAQASSEGLADAKAKLAPRALLWFRWGSVATLVTGVLLFGGVAGKKVLNDFIILGAVMGTVMFFNVWHIIWPNQKIILGLKEGDSARAAVKASLASRTNVLLSAPMLFCMLASSHLGYTPEHLMVANGGGLGLWIALAAVALIELNAIFGKMGPMASIRGVIHISLVASALFFCILIYL